jgi:diphthamide biosynthesis protein 4
VFEEMLREEGMAEGGGSPTGKFWSLVGGLSGGAMGFIVANFPGMLAGAVAGNRLGAIRDAKGKSVYAVFQVGSFAWLDRVDADSSCRIYRSLIKRDF